jgi:hypothetical protein
MADNLRWTPSRRSSSGHEPGRRKGSIVGTFVGALLIAIIRNGLNLLGVEYYYQIVLTGAIILEPPPSTASNRCAKAESFFLPLIKIGACGRFRGRRRLFFYVARFDFAEKSLLFLKNFTLYFYGYPPTSYLSEYIANAAVMIEIAMQAFLKQGEEKMLWKKNTVEPAENHTGSPAALKQKRMPFFKNIKGAPDNEGSREKFIVKNIFHIATMVSSFDLRLSFYSDQIKKDSNRMHRTSTGVAAASEEISAATGEIVGANAELSDKIGKVSEEAKVLYENTTKGNELLKNIKWENTAMLHSSKDMQESVANLLESLKRSTKP